MESYLSPLETFKRHFDQYISYMSPPCADAGILKVSYQFLSGNQERALAEMVGFVRKAGPVPIKREFQVIPGFRR